MSSSPGTRRPAWLLAVLALLAVVVAGGTIALVVDPSDEQHAAPATITVPVDGLDAGTADDRTIEVPKATVEQVAPKLENDLRDPPATTPEAELAAVQRAEDVNRRTTEALPVAGATAGFAGCTTTFVNNQSSRNGVRPIWMVDHYTVSHNVRGRADGNAVVALFNRRSAQASSNFIIDAEGNCWYIVPIERKAWAQADANSLSISFEIIAYGNEREYLPAAGLRKLAAVQREVSRRTGIPMRRGSTRGCSPGRSGIVQHKDFGLCGGGHVDITPFSIDAVVGQTIALAGGGASSCDLTCRRKASHIATHAEMRRRHCAPRDKPTRSERCKTLRRRDNALHRVGVKF